MNAIRTKTFRSGNSEAVRLPKEIAFGPGTEVELVRKGNEVTIRAKRPTVADMLEKLRGLPQTKWAIDRPEAPEREWRD